jgi:phosphatidylglycerol:prolipoprotein diacylglycerol transferase
VYPTLFHLGHLLLPTFGALSALGLILALLLSERTAPLAGVAPGKLWDAGLFAVLAAFVLSRVLLALAYFETFRRFPLLLLTVPSLTATGLLLTVIATALWLRLKGVAWLRALDAWAPCGALVWAALALGHFAEGSDPGLATPLPWGLPPMPGDALRLHPVALYAALAATVLTFGAFRLLRRRPQPGTAAGWTLVAAGLAQFLLSFLRQPGVEAALGLDALEWVAVGLITVGCGLVARTMFGSEGQ